MNGLAQDLRPTGGDFCGAWSNANFGKEVPVLSYDEQILKGWYNRPSDWQITATVQQEVFPRVSVEVGYTRRWLQNFTVTDNLAVAPSDFTMFSVTAPNDPRLPGGGGYVVSGLYNVNPDKFSAIDNYRTYAPVYGNVSQVYNGVDVNVSARLRGGLTVQGGTSTGQQVIDSCERARQAAGTGLGRRVLAGRNSVQPDEPVLPRGAGHHDASDRRRYLPRAAGRRATVLRVHEQPGRATPGRLAGAARDRGTLPRASAVGERAQRRGEPARAGPDALAAREHSRLPRGQACCVSATRELNVAVDLYNVLNLDTVVTQNFNYVPNGAWLVPTEVLTARTAKMTVQYDF